MITFEQLDPTSRASITAIEAKNVKSSVADLIIPQRIAVLAQYNSGATGFTANVAKTGLESSDEVGNLFGWGSMAHCIARKLYPVCGNVPVDWFPLADAGGSAAAAGTITITGPSTSAGVLSLYIAGQKITCAVASGEAQNTTATNLKAAIDAVKTIPVTSGACPANAIPLTAKWAGATGNDINVAMNLGGDYEIAQAPAGVTVVIVEPTAGATDPAISTALANFGPTWYTIVVSPYDDATSYGAINTAGATRIGPTIKRPFAAFAGSIRAKAAQIVLADAINSPYFDTVPVPNSPNMPCEIAGAVAGVAAKRWQVNPGRKCYGLPLTGITAGSSLDPWTFEDRDALVKKGSSTTYIDASGVVRIGDLVLTYNTNGAGARDELWLFHEYMSKRQAKEYSVEATFDTEPFTSGVVVDNDAVTDLDYAIRPRTVIAYAHKLIDELWGPLAWSKNTDDIKAGCIAEINSGNPARIDLMIPDDEAVNLRQTAVLLKFSISSQGA